MDLKRLKHEFTATLIEFTAVNSPRLRKIDLSYLGQSHVIQTNFLSIVMNLEHQLRHLLEFTA